MLAASDATMPLQKTRPMQQEKSVLGMAIAKRVFHTVERDERRTIVCRQRLAWHDLMRLRAQLPPVRIGMHTCSTFPPSHPL
jgi:hypothetical protein